MLINVYYFNRFKSTLKLQLLYILLIVSRYYVCLFFFLIGFFWQCNYTDFRKWPIPPQFAHLKLISVSFAFIYTGIIIIVTKAIACLFSKRLCDLSRLASNLKNYLCWTSVKSWILVLTWRATLTSSFWAFLALSIDPTYRDRVGLVDCDIF